MKASYYNYHIPYKGKILLYNTLSGCGFVMTKDEHCRLMNLMQNLNDFSSTYPQDFEKLRTIGVVVDDDFDELAYIKYQNKVITAASTHYELCINPTLECNFKCWYCYETHRQGHMAPEIVESVKKHIKHKIESGGIESLTISWFGGEPLLYYKEVIVPIASFAKELCDNKGVKFFSGATTNGYCFNHINIAELTDIGLNAFQITIDGNKERHDKIRHLSGEPTYDIIMNNIVRLCRNNASVRITLRINYDVQTLVSGIEDVLNDIPNDIKDQIRIDLHRVWQVNKKLNEFSNSIDQFIHNAKERGLQCVSAGGLRPKRFYNCYTCKYNFACINFDGLVYKCTARDFTEDNAIGKLTTEGVINWNYSKVSRLYGHSPLENETCAKCNLLPLCMGPCPQKYMENEYSIKNLCLRDSVARTVEEMIIDLYEYTHKCANQSL